MKKNAKVWVSLKVQEGPLSEKIRNKANTHKGGGRKHRDGQ